MIVFPYSFDDKEYYDPNKFPYSDGGLAAWILHNKRPYCFKLDDRFLLNKGRKFGDKSRRSEDAVSVPIFESTDKGVKKVIGLMSMLSYQPNSYDEHSIQALEWLALDITVVLARERENEVRRRDLGDPDASIVEPMLRPDNIVNQMLEKMASIRRRADGIRDLLTEQHTEEICSALNTLCQECERRQTETIELFLRSVLMQNNPMSDLSKRERDVVILLVEGFAQSQEGYSNEEIADKLGISEDTVKTHLKHINKKVGISGRSGVAEIMKPFVSRNLLNM